MLKGTGLRRGGPALAAGIVGALAAAAGGALAAGSNGTITACVHKSSGALYRSSHCARHDRTLTWNVQGPPGAQGIQGPPGPATGTAGGALTGHYPNPGLAAGAVGTSQFGTIPAVEVANSTDQPIPNSTNTPLGFDTNVYDNDAMHSTTANNTRLTAPISGIYEVTGQIAWDVGGGTLRVARIDVDGSSSDAIAASQAPNPTHSVYQEVTGQLHLNAGDYVELVGAQDSGASLGAYVDSRFAMHWVGP